MTDAVGSVPDQVAGRKRTSIGDLVRATEVDLRLFGMVAALAAILIGFGIATGGRFLEPVNLLTLSVQGASVAIIATGMVMVIVSRNIDLSVGSLVGVLGMSYAVLMADIFPKTIGVNHPIGWIIALAIGVALGALIGGFQGFIIAYVGVPSFVVTLGGLLAFRGVVWVLSGGTTVAPDDATFVLIGGGPAGSLGGMMSWVLGIAICVAVVFLLFNARRQRRKFGFLLDALQYGAPPHGGIAPGIDRIVMLLAGEENLREIVLFPMNQKAEDLLMGAPSEVSPKQLKELNIRIDLPKK